MVNRYLLPKFGVNPLDAFRENDVYGRRTDDRGPHDDSSSAVQWHKAELKTVAFRVKRTKHCAFLCKIECIHITFGCYAFKIILRSFDSFAAIFGKFES